MGISSAMEIGKNGLNIYRVATEVTGENIANVNTPGYSRQRIILETAPPTTNNGFPMGTGVLISSVERVYDSLLQQQLISAQTTQGYDTTKSNVLQQIEPSFNEVTNDGLGAAITGFFNAWQNLSINPSGVAERQEVLTESQVLADNFHSISKTLNDSIAIQNASLPSIVDSINATLNRVAELNGQIKSTELVSGNANEMRDQRDQLIRDLSQKIGISFTENKDGTTDVQFNGTSIISGTFAGSFSLAANSLTGKYDVKLAAANGGVPTVVTPTTGQLGATLALRDTIIPGYLAQVDTLASTITSSVNAVHTAGFDLNGNPGIALFDPAATTAAGFGLNPALTLTSQIAASSSPLLTGDNGNALALLNLQVQKIMSGNTATLNNFVDSLVSQVGLDVATSKRVVSQDDAFMKQLNTLRDSNSGVSLDEELTNLIKYQKSYQASARLVTTATEMMDTVLGLIR